MPKGPQPTLYLSPPWHIACTVLAVFPLPGLGTLLAGIKNPHTRFTLHGALQLVLVVFGSWPLIVPGVAGLAWAVWSAVQIHRHSRAPPPWSHPTSL